jgi:hypothetical protein
VDFRRGIYLLTAEWLGNRMTATDWEIGRRIVELEPAEQKRTGYGEEVVRKLSKDLSYRFGRGFGRRKLGPSGKFTFPLSDNFQSVIGGFAAVAGERLNSSASALPLLSLHFVVATCGG